MAYCRRSEGDVYLFPATGENGEDVYCCGGCMLSGQGSVEFPSPEEAWDHLLAHRRAGHVVPDAAFFRLEREFKS